MNHAHRIAILIAAQLGLYGCANSVDHEPSPVGGWSSALGLHACFGENGALVLDDKVPLELDRASCTWTSDGGFACPHDDATGDWTISDGAEHEGVKQISLTASTGCSPDAPPHIDGSCGPYVYVWAPSLAGCSSDTP